MTEKYQVNSTRKTAADKLMQRFYRMYSAIFPSTPKSHRKGFTYPKNGKRECERRMRQIACGQLTESNGLVRG